MLAAAAATHNAARLFDDDEYDDNDQHGTIEESPSLKSLQKQALPILPDEQDRKRFVGCLAAVLASLYDYDDDQHAEHGDENDYDPDDMSNYPADNVSDSFYEDWDDDVEDNDYSSSSQARSSSTSENYGSSSKTTAARHPHPTDEDPSDNSCDAITATRLRNSNDRRCRVRGPNNHNQQQQQPETQCLRRGLPGPTEASPEKVRSLFPISRLFGRTAAARRESGQVLCAHAFQTGILLIRP